LPQYHVVYDDHFSTVSNAASSGFLDDEVILSTVWDRLVEAGTERYLDDLDYDDRGRCQTLPELHDNWLSLAEHRVRAISRWQRRNRMFPLPPSPLARATGPVSAPEGDRDQDESDTAPAPLIVTALPPDLPPTLPDPPDLDLNAADTDLPSPGDEDDDDDALSLVSLPDDIDPDEFPFPEDDDSLPDLEEREDSDDESDEEDAQPMGRGQRC